MVIITDDGKYWTYDSEHQAWIDVSVDNPKLKKLMKNAVRVK